MEITSGILTVEQIQIELDATPDIFTRHGIEQVTVFFGYGSNGNIDELWKEHVIPVSELLGFAQSGIDRDLFETGRSDLYVQSKDETTVLQFCHDSDIHFKTTDEALNEEMTQRWKSQGFPGYIKDGDNWVCFDDHA